MKTGDWRYISSRRPVATEDNRRHCRNRWQSLKWNVLCCYSQFNSVRNHTYLGGNEEHEQAMLPRDLYCCLVFHDFRKDHIKFQLLTKCVQLFFYFNFNFFIQNVRILCCTAKQNSSRKFGADPQSGSKGAAVLLSRKNTSLQSYN